MRTCTSTRFAAETTSLVLFVLQLALSELVAAERHLADRGLSSLPTHSVSAAVLQGDAKPLADDNTEAALLVHAALSTPLAANAQLYFDRRTRLECCCLSQQHCLVIQPNSDGQLSTRAGSLMCRYLLSRPWRCVADLLRDRHPAPAAGVAWHAAGRSEQER